MPPALQTLLHSTPAVQIVMAHCCTFTQTITEPLEDARVATGNQDAAILLLDVMQPRSCNIAPLQQLLQAGEGMHNTELHCCFRSHAGAVIACIIDKT